MIVQIKIGLPYLRKNLLHFSNIETVMCNLDMDKILLSSEGRSL